MDGWMVIALCLSPCDVYTPSLPHTTNQPTHPHTHPPTHQLVTSARLEAASRGTADIAIVTTGAEGERERPTFITSFSFNKKPFQVYMWMGSVGVSKSASKGITPTIQPSKQPNRTKSFTTINTTTTTTMDHKNNTTTTSGRGPPLHGGRDGPCLRRGAQAAVDGAAQGEVVKHTAHKHTTPTHTHPHTYKQIRQTQTHTHTHMHLQTKHTNTQTHTW